MAVPPVAGAGRYPPESGNGRPGLGAGSAKGLWVVLRRQGRSRAGIMFYR